MQCCGSPLREDGENSSKRFFKCEACGQQYEARKLYTPVKYTPAFIRRK